MSAPASPVPHNEARFSANLPQKEEIDATKATTDCAAEEGKSKAAEEPKLPPLSRKDFKEYNRMAEHMEIFHNHFRQVWTMMDKACKDRKRPSGMSLREFIDEGLQFVRQLGIHHSIEETYIFPVLAKRMPEFQPPDKKKGKAARNKDAVKAAQLVQQHRDIHHGMDGMEEYLKRCRNKETELELSVLKAQMDTWGQVLWQHLDEEVKTLGAENMRKYWSLEEMRRLQI